MDLMTVKKGEIVCENMGSSYLPVSVIL